jgi:aryl-alcohol dehydrogenase-like predicted oxidoreductase
MGLGCGGHSRLGLSTGSTETEAENVVRAALSLGINFIDTAEGYGTEEVVGRGIAQAPRDRIVLSTKAGVGWQDRKCTGVEMRHRVDACLKRLNTDYIDVFHVHGLRVDDYMYACVELMPTLLDLKLEGKIRFVGVTEAFGPDPSHLMLTRAVRDAFWDVVMVGFNILNQSARTEILARTQEKEIGTLCMFAVRRVLSHPELLPDLMGDLVSHGQIDGDAFDHENPLGFLIANGIADNVQDAAYRFCRWEPGIDIVLSGTGDVAHLKSNVLSLGRPPLPGEIRSRLRTIFARVDSISGN